MCGAMTDCSLSSVAISFMLDWSFSARNKIYNVARKERLKGKAKGDLLGKRRG